MGSNREGGIYYLSWQVTYSGWLHYDFAGGMAGRIEVA